MSSAAGTVGASLPGWRFLPGSWAASPPRSRLQPCWAIGRLPAPLPTRRVRPGRAKRGGAHRLAGRQAASFGLQRSVGRFRRVRLDGFGGRGCWRQLLAACPPQLCWFVLDAAQLLTPPGEPQPASRRGGGSRPATATERRPGSRLALGLSRRIRRGLDGWDGCVAGC